MRSVAAAVLAALLATAAQAQPVRLGAEAPAAPSLAEPLPAGPLGLPEADRLLEAAAASRPAPPASFAFQGVLHDGGAPVSDGTYAVTVRLFVVATGGGALYAEDHTVQTTGGVFAVSVGAGTPVTGTFSGVNFSEAVWVEVAWAGTTLSPRTLIEPAPVARTLVGNARVIGEGSYLLHVWNVQASGSVSGVRGTSISTTGSGVLGVATASTGETDGVLGISESSSGRGVAGVALSSSGTTYGIHGESSSSSGRGVYGWASRGSGTTFGVYGEVASPDGFAGFFDGGRGLRVRPAALAVAADAALSGEDVLVEAADAVVGLYSDGGGAWGSALVLGEVGGLGALESKWAVVRQTSGGNRALYFTYGTSANYAANNAVLRVDTDGSVHADGPFFNSGADLAEFFPLVASGAGTEAVRPGDLVGVRGGHVSLAASGAEQVMVASTDPAFVGNPDAEAGGALVALVGQAEVRVSGAASVGDLLVASGRDDGTARAVAPAAYDPEADGPVAGRVLTAPEAGRVVALVGVDEAAALRDVVVALRADQEAGRARLDAQQAQIDALTARLDALTVSASAN